MGSIPRSNYHLWLEDLPQELKRYDPFLEKIILTIAAIVTVPAILTNR